MIVYDRRQGSGARGKSNSKAQEKGDSPANYTSSLSYVPLSRQNGFSYRQGTSKRSEDAARIVPQSWGEEDDEDDEDATPPTEVQHTPLRFDSDGDSGGDSGAGGRGGAGLDDDPFPTDNRLDEIDQRMHALGLSSSLNLAEPLSSREQTPIEERLNALGTMPLSSSSSHGPGPEAGFTAASFADLFAPSDSKLDVAEPSPRPSRLFDTRAKKMKLQPERGETLADKLNAVVQRPATAMAASELRKKSSERKVSWGTRSTRVKSKPRVPVQRPYTTSSIRRERKSRAVSTPSSPQECPDLKLIARSSGLVNKHMQELDGLKGSVDLHEKKKNPHYKHKANKRYSKKSSAANCKGPPNIDVEVEKDIAPNLAKYLNRLQKQRSTEKERQQRTIDLEQRRKEREERRRLRADGGSDSNDSDEADKQAPRRPKSMQEWSRLHSRRRLQTKVMQADMALESTLSLNEKVRADMEGEQTTDEIRALHMASRQGNRKMTKMISDIHSRQSSMKSRLSTIQRKPEPVPSGMFNSQLISKYEQRAQNLLVYRQTMRKLKRPRDDLCAICLSNMEVGETVITLECKHLFHADCLLEWLTRMEECPLCKASTIPKTKKQQKSKWTGSKYG